MSNEQRLSASGDATPFASSSLTNDGWAAAAGLHVDIVRV